MMTLTGKLQILAASLNRPLIKICGLTSLHDAVLAKTSGADCLGFIFVPGTQRCLTLSQAQAIIQSLKEHREQPVCLIGVFQDASLQQMRRMILALNLDAVQCHGNEPASVLKKLGVPVIKTLTLSDGMTLEALAEQAENYTGLPDSIMPYFLLDMAKDSDLTMAAQLESMTLHGRAVRASDLQAILADKPYWLAGRLSAEQLPTLLAAYRPAGVDVASGVEQLGDGHSLKKDPAKMHHFCQTVRDLSLSNG